MDKDFLPGYEKIVFKKPKSGFKYFFFKYTRNILVAVFAMAIIFVNAGIFLTWYHNKDIETPKEEAIKTSPVAKKEPTQQAEDARVSVSIQTLNSSAKPGEKVYLSVKTNTKADCDVEAKYGEVLSSDVGLIPKKADEYGVVSWSFNIDSDAQLGRWPVTVTCRNKSNSGVVIGYVNVE